MIKKCPQCGKDQKYTTKKIFKVALKNDSLCKSCIQSGDKNYGWNGASLLTGDAKKQYNRNRSYKFSYGITLEDYNKIFAEQHGCCKICNIHQTELTRKLFVDHCHITGKVRGLLCFSCNTGLGMFKDKLELLKKAVDYFYEN